VAADKLAAHIETTPGVAGGRPRVAGRRITVQNIAIWHERLGLDPDEIAAEHDLSLADVHAALAYYFDHREEIDSVIAADESWIASLRKRTRSPLYRKVNRRAARGRG
jgi:uncharacterized protein (DUF433 family)